MVLGRPNVDAMLTEMSNLQFNEWMAYAQLEPFGEQRADLRMGILTAALKNTMLSLWSKNRGDAKPEDFIPDFEKAAEEALVPPHIRLQNKIKAVFGRMVR